MIGAVTFGRTLKNFISWTILMLKMPDIFVVSHDLDFTQFFELLLFNILFLLFDLFLQFFFPIGFVIHLLLESCRFKCLFLGLLGRAFILLLLWPNIILASLLRLQLFWIIDLIIYLLLWFQLVLIFFWCFLSHLEKYLLIFIRFLKLFKCGLLFFWAALFLIGILGIFAFAG